jgi:hypothetical protein
MTPKEALEVFSHIQLEFPSHPHLKVCKNINDVQEAFKTIKQALNDYEDLKINNERQFKAWQKCKKQKHECGVKLRNLKKDIKRYFKLLEIRLSNYILNDDELRELIELEQKLKEA